MSADAVVIHGHVYQPPRADPRTGVVPVERTAAPFHDWNERITAECYRPNAFARIFDERGRISAIVNNFEKMSFDLGPTLAHWLDAYAPEVAARMAAADRAGATAIAHPFHHAILPLADERDALTELRWGIADFSARFGRQPEGMWLPETGIDDRTLGQLAALGIAFTIVAPHQVESWPAPGTVGLWRAAGGGATGSAAGGREVRLVVYDGSASHDIAFGTALADTRALIDRLASAAPSGLAVVAADAETFGHHHRFTERGVAHALFEEAPSRGLATGALAPFVAGAEVSEVGGVRASAWSCAHGLGRWQVDCGCSTDGPQGWSQAWRAPLRSALTMLRDHAVDVFVRRGADVFHDPWAARDGYGAVLADRSGWDDFVTDHVRPLADESQAAALLASQEATLASFTSCAWFFADLARREVAIVLQEAARSIDLLRALGEEPPLAGALAVLATAESNDRDLPTGRDVWEWAVGSAHGAGDADEPWMARRPAPLESLLDELVRGAIAGDAAAAGRAQQLVGLLGERAHAEGVSLDRAQEAVWAARTPGGSAASAGPSATAEGRRPDLDGLAEALGLAV